MTTVADAEFVKVRVQPDGRLNAENAARYLGCTAKTLANLRSQRKGPPHGRVNGRVYYFKTDLDDYIAKGFAPHRGRHG